MGNRRVQCGSVHIQREENDTSAIHEDGTGAD